MPKDDPLSKTGMYMAIKTAIQEEVQPIKTLMKGPEGEPQKGFIIRMDRVERICKTLVWGFALILSAFVLAGVANLVNKIFNQ